MADASNLHQRPKIADEHRLKYLGFVLAAFIHALMFVAKLYNYAKTNSGPLKPSVNTVENTVRSIVGPVCGKFDYVPIEILKFADRKIDESVNRVQNRLPTSLKRASSKAFKNARKAPIAARSVMSDVKNTGMVETASGLAKSVYAKYEPVAKAFYSKYEPVTEQYVLYVWNFLNQYAIFHRAIQTVGPIASYCSEMYNEKVQDAAEKGYKVASHLPLVPTEKIGKVLNGNGNGNGKGNVRPVVEVTTNGEAVAAS